MEVPPTLGETSTVVESSSSSHIPLPALDPIPGSDRIPTTDGGIDATTTTTTTTDTNATDSIMAAATRPGHLADEGRAGASSSIAFEEEPPTSYPKEDSNANQLSGPKRRTPNLGIPIIAPEGPTTSAQLNRPTTNGHHYLVHHPILEYERKQSEEFMDPSFESEVGYDAGDGASSSSTSEPQKLDGNAVKDMVAERLKAWNDHYHAHVKPVEQEEKRARMKAKYTALAKDKRTAAPMDELAPAEIAILAPPVTASVTELATSKVPGALPPVPLWTPPQPDDTSSHEIPSSGAESQALPLPPPPFPPVPFPPGMLPPPPPPFCMVMPMPFPPIPPPIPPPFPPPPALAVAFATSLSTPGSSVGGDGSSAATVTTSTSGGGSSLHQLSASAKPFVPSSALQITVKDPEKSKEKDNKKKERKPGKSGRAAQRLASMMERVEQRLAGTTSNKNNDLRNSKIEPSEGEDSTPAVVAPPVPTVAFVKLANNRTPPLGPITAAPTALPVAVTAPATATVAFVKLGARATEPPPVLPSLPVRAVLSTLPPPPPSNLTPATSTPSKPVEETKELTVPGDVATYGFFQGSFQSEEFGISFSFPVIPGINTAPGIFGTSADNNEFLSWWCLADQLDEPSYAMRLAPCHPDLQKMLQVIVAQEVIGVDVSLKTFCTSMHAHVQEHLPTNSSITFSPCRSIWNEQFGYAMEFGFIHLTFDLKPPEEEEGSDEASRPERCNEVGREEGQARKGPVIRAIYGRVWVGRGHHGDRMLIVQQQMCSDRELRRPPLVPMSFMNIQLFRPKPLFAGRSPEDREAAAARMIQRAWVQCVARRFHALWAGPGEL